MIFALARQLTRVLGRRQGRYAELDADWAALLVAALWLLSPLNFTPVLYVVQRMTSLAALFVLAGLWCHVTGRLRLADGDSRGLWLALGGLPLAGIGILAKETVALYPLLVLALEWTLLRSLATPRRGLILASTAVLPIILGIFYLASHPGMLNFDGRAFTLGERLVTEARVLWLYLRMLFVPDLSMLGLFHDDVATSTSLATPWTTLPAVIVWLALTAAAIALAKRWPVASFAVLFFLAGHVLESSIFPLELIFEHRNYLPSFGPWFAVGVGGLLLADHVRHGRWLKLGLAVYLALLAGVTHLRAWDWSNEDRLTLSEAERHPQSMRANFVLAKRLISALPTAPDPAQIYALARHYLEHVRALAPDNLDALFALVVLNLHVSRQPEAGLGRAAPGRAARAAWSIPCTSRPRNSHTWSNGTWRAATPCHAKPSSASSRRRSRIPDSTVTDGLAFSRHFAPIIWRYCTNPKRHWYTHRNRCATGRNAGITRSGWWSCWCAWAGWRTLSGLCPPRAVSMLPAPTSPRPPNWRN